MKKFFITFLLLSFFGIVARSAELNVSQYMLNFPEPEISDLDAGYLDFDHYSGGNHVRLLVNVEGNSKWNIYIFSEQPALYSGQYDIPIEKLLWKLAIQPVTGYRPVTMNKTLLMSGSGSYTIDLNYRLLLDWSTPPGFYNIQVFYDLEILE